MFHCDEENTSIAGKRCDASQNKCDEEGNATIFNECYDVLKNKSDEGNASTMKYLELSE